MAITGLGMTQPTYSPPSGGAPLGSSQTSDDQKTIADFESWANMTPAQRMRANVLASMGLTEDDLKNMTPQQRKAVEDTIQQRIKEEAEHQAQKGKTGLVADVT